MGDDQRALPVPEVPEHRGRLGRGPLRVLPGHQAQLAPLPRAHRLDLFPGEGWEFIQFGNFVERADKTHSDLGRKIPYSPAYRGDVGGALDTAQWQAVLRSASALEAYRRFYVREILPWKVAEFLIFSDSFPRSVHFCVAQIDEFLRRILGESGPRPRSEAARASRRLLADLQSLTIDEVLKDGLHEFLVEIANSLEKISDAVVQTTMFYQAESTQEEQQLQQQQ